MPVIKKLSIIIPVYNEVGNIANAIESVKKIELPYNIEKEILVVDDASTDGTKKVLEDLEKKESDTIILYHEKNRWKWAAIRTALSRVTWDYTIIHDADSEYDVADFLPMIELIESGKAKVVYGSRRLWDNKQYSHVSFLLGGILLSHLTNILYGQHITDEPTCYKLVPTKMLLDMHLVCERFEFCPEVTAKVARMGETIHEVPIKYYPRSIEQGKKIRWKDGVEAIVTLLRYRFWKP
jgi:dolichol-phosphate mannosyltransferase